MTAIPQPQFPGAWRSGLQSYEALSAAQWLYRLANRHAYADILPAAWTLLQQRLQAITPAQISAVLPAFEAQAAPPLAALETAQQCLALSPLGMTPFCWLQNVSQPANSYEAEILDLSQIFAAAFAARRAFLNRASRFDLAIPGLAGHAFGAQTALDPAALRQAVLQLCLAAFPRLLLPEICGYTLACCKTPWLAEQCDPKLLQLAGNAAQRQAQHDAQRVASGFAFYYRLLEELASSLPDTLNRDSLANRMALLFAGKARYGAGIHAGIALGAKSLDRWFAEQPFDAAGFLAALAASPFVDREHPEQSALLKRLTRFGGPMFGIFSGPELDCIREWLRQGAPLPAANDLRPAGSRIAFDRPRTDSGSAKPQPMRIGNARTFYHCLINAELYPACLPAARRLAQKNLALKTFFGKNPLPCVYDAENFLACIDALHSKETAKIAAFAPPPRVPKALYLWAMEQFAPAVLIDGCWLQHASEAAMDEELSWLLWRIYDDETGNGHKERNHPYIYRQLLQRLGIDLPAVSSREFAQHPGFVDSAFDLPNHLLSLSLFPRDFLPELLGINLAIEISGLGAVYTRMADEMDYWGIPSYIVRLHNSVDTLAGGHAAIAVQAVIGYLDKILALQGDAARQRHWRRIVNGYASLGKVCGRFKRDLLWQYGKQWLRGRLPAVGGTRPRRAG